MSVDNIIKEHLLTVEDFAKARKQGVSVILPSGMEVFIRPMYMRNVLRNFEFVPNELIGQIQSMIEETEGKKPSKPPVFSREDTLKQYDFLEKYAESVIVKPVVVRSEDADGLYIHDISEEDLGFLFALINKPLRDIQRFSEYQKEYNTSMEYESGLPSDPLPSDESDPPT